MDATTAFSDAPEPLLGAADAVETKARKEARRNVALFGDEWTRHEMIS